MAENEKIEESFMTEQTEDAQEVEATPNLMSEKTENALVVENKEKEYLERIARLQAEFENFRKRNEKEKQENLTNSNASLIFQMLKVLDNFELSLKHNADKGVRLIYDELREILKKHGLKVIDTNGDFNPKLHEALIKVDGERDGVILEVIQNGYMLNDKLLRPSKVKICKVMEKK